VLLFLSFWLKHTKLFFKPTKVHHKKIRERKF
jgi:hypothetical protein